MGSPRCNVVTKVLGKSFIFHRFSNFQNLQLSSCNVMYMLDNCTMLRHYAVELVIV